MLLGTNSSGSVIDALLASALLDGDGQSDVVDDVSHWPSRMQVTDRLEVRQAEPRGVPAWIGSAVADNAGGTHRLRYHSGSSMLT
jgi:hypothetical protein